MAEQAELSAEEAQWLKEHRLAVLATGRKDGSPQQSLLGYQFDGSQFLLGGQATAAKMRNLQRQRRCSLTVVDGRGYATVYGAAELVEDEVEMAKLQERFGPRQAPPRPAGAPAPAARPMGKRGNVLFTPDKYVAGRMLG